MSKRYFIHTYTTGSGGKRTKRRTVYDVEDADKAADNLAVLGGDVELVEVLKSVPHSTKR